jgi:cytochrome P450
MDKTYKNGEPLSMKEITGIMVATLLGGQHTSNVTGAWAMCHLFKDPEWWEKVMTLTSFPLPTARVCITRCINGRSILTLVPMTP